MMKTIKLMFTLAAIFMVQATSTFAHNPGLPPVTKWDKLGQKKVDFRLDKDEIKVTIVQGLFTAIKLKVKDGPINMHKCVVHFKNGTKQNVNIRKNIPAGGETRVIQLDGGGKRIIKKVVFLYDSKRPRDKATVALWGKH
ncbi:MAG: DUF2541 family protein [Saprospiraceae bacterium]|nr:DUF2541 family protein [Saprospiraceae bacterium]